MTSAGRTPSPVHDHEWGTPCPETCPAYEWAREHRPVSGDDFMPAGWCGGCEVCYPAPMICLACSYDPNGESEPRPVPWPCEMAPARMSSE